MNKLSCPKNIHILICTKYSEYCPTYLYIVHDMMIVKKIFQFSNNFLQDYILYRSTRILATLTTNNLVYYVF